jgi:hypothetical protein
MSSPVHSMTLPSMSTPTPAPASRRASRKGVGPQLLALLALGLTLGAPVPAFAKATVVPAQVRAIHQLADLGSNVQSFCETLIETAEITLRTEGHPIATQLDATQQKRWLASMRHACDVERANERHLAAFAADYNPEAARKVTDWYASDAGKRLLALENAAAETDWDAEVVPFIDEITKVPVPVERVKLFERIDTAVGSTEDAAILQSGIGEVLTWGAQALLPPAQRTPRAELDAQFAALRNQYAGQMRAQQSVIFMFVYRQATDEDLEAYTVFVESPSARWLHTSHRMAMMQLIAELREEVAQEVQGD